MTHTRTIPYPYHGATHVPGLVPPFQRAMGQNEGEVALSHIQHHSFSGDRPLVTTKKQQNSTTSEKSLCKVEVLDHHEKTVSERHILHIILNDVVGKRCPRNLNSPCGHSMDASCFSARCCWFELLSLFVWNCKTPWNTSSMLTAWYYGITLDGGTICHPSCEANFDFCPLRVGTLTHQGALTSTKMLYSTHPKRSCDNVALRKPPRWVPPLACGHRLSRKNQGPKNGTGLSMAIWSKLVMITSRFFRPFSPSAKPLKPLDPPVSLPLQPCLRHIWKSLQHRPQLPSRGYLTKFSVEPVVGWHGSLNVPIEHHPTIRYMVYNGYYKVMSNIPKMGHLPTPLWVWSIRNALLGWKKTATCSSTAIWGAVKSPSCSWSCSLPSISNKRTSWYSQVESSLKFAPVTVSCKLKKNKILTSVARYKASHHSRRVLRQHQRLLFAKIDHLMTGRRVFSGRPNLVNRHNRVGLVLRKQMVWKYEIDVFSMVVETWFNVLYNYTFIYKWRSDLKNWNIVV